MSRQIRTASNTTSAAGALAAMKAIIVVLAFVGVTQAVRAEGNLPVIRSNTDTITIKDGETLKKNEWHLSPETNPDVYEAELIDGKPHKVTFTTDVDAISFQVEMGRTYDFIIRWNGKDCHTRIVGTRLVPAARFDQNYQSQRRGKIFVDIPEVYELVNIAIAMTSTGMADEDLVYHGSDYYRSMRAWFDRFRGHPLLAALDAELKKGQYFNLKMNGYAFAFDANGRIVPSPVFDRTGWGKDNALRPFIAGLQAFSDQTRFRDFFRANRNTYDEQIRFYRETANIAGMKRWLDRNFPSSNNYDTYNIIFSPLVAYNQSSNWFESNGFRELQPHVNFPYPQDIRSLRLSPQAEIVYRGNIVFTEINHGYINPEAEKYAERIAKATSHRNLWVDTSMVPEQYRAGYYNGNAAFDEYMNWALVNLRFTDELARDEQGAAIAAVNRMMKGRGFPRFAVFSQFLVDHYRARPPGQTVADLYPQIIEWFDKNNQAP